MRGQLEILGLAIIVVIVIFAILLTLIFMPKTNKDSLESNVVDSTIASNLLNVILKTTLDCKDIELQSILEDCALGVNTKDYCQKYSGYESRPCELVKMIIKENILDKTLSVWKKNYTFIALNGTRSLFNITNTPICMPGKYSKRFSIFTSESMPVSLILDGDQKMEISISLYICR
jgi:hypothetical protein